MTCCSGLAQIAMRMREAQPVHWTGINRYLAFSLAPQPLQLPNADSEDDRNYTIQVTRYRNWLGLIHNAVHNNTGYIPFATQSSNGKKKGKQYTNLRVSTIYGSFVATRV